MITSWLKKRNSCHMQAVWENDDQVMGFFYEHQNMNLGYFVKMVCKNWINSIHIYILSHSFILVQWTVILTRRMAATMYNGAFLEDLEAFFDGKCYSAADLICFLFFVFCFFKSTSFRNNSQRNEENSTIFFSTILNLTIACLHIFFSEPKHC